jgi:outer membrane protein OmpA-like peptidoglycan-associated protein
MAFQERDLGIGDSEAGTWPAFADLLAACTMLFLVLFTVVAVPALRGYAEGIKIKNTLGRIERDLKDRQAESGFEVQTFGDYVLIRIRGDATFTVGKAGLQDLRPEGRQTLRTVADVLEQDSLLKVIDQVQIVGHTSLEGTDTRNWRLSSERATTIALFFIDSLGVGACKITSLGRGRFYPTNKALADTSRVPIAADRRIELEIRPVIEDDKAQAQRREQCLDRALPPQ